MSRIAWEVVVVLAVLSGVVGAQPLFDAPRVWDDGRQFVAAGDLNGDARADLISLAGQGTLLIISINDGQGGFTDQGQIASSNLSSNQFGMGDVDGDGFNDLVMAHSSAALVSVFLGSGTGTLGAPSSSAISGIAAKLFMGRANGDGLSDVLLHIDVNGTWQLQWLVSGPMGFTAAPALPSQAVPAGLDFAALDLQADGLTDLAMFDSANGGQLRTFATASGGTIVNASSLPTPASFVAGAQVVAGDFLANGTTDLALVQPEPGSPSTPQMRILVFANSGLGNFTAQTEQQPPMRAPIAGQLFAGDWDNDGADDLIHYTGDFPMTPIVYWPGIELFSNSGSGQFALEWQVTYSARFAEGVGMMDLDGDGRSDLVTSSFVTISAAGGGPPNDESSVNWRGNLVDVDGDGDVDLFNKQQQTFSVNDGRGFAQNEFDFIQQLPPLPSNQLYRPALYCDLDGDGDLDGISQLRTISGPSFPGFPPLTNFNSMRTLINDRSGIFQDIGVSVSSGGPQMRLDITSVEWFQTPLVADFDGDGRFDILGHGEFWRATATGVWAEDPGSYWQQWVPLDMGDVDGDGDMDILASRQTAIQMQVAVHINDGSGVFTSMVLSGAIPNDRAAAFGDADDDGDLDVVVVLPFTIYENVGTGFNPISIPEPNPIRPERVNFADLNGDGQTDLFFTNDASRESICRVLLSNGPGLSFAPFQSYIARETAGVADIDGDGDLDIMGRGQSLNRLFQTPAAGTRRQYGAATAGTNGQSPLFGVEGPMRIGETLTFNLRGITGGALGVLSFGYQESDLPDFPFLGSTTLNFPWTTLLPLPAAPGTLGVMGQGNFSFQATMPPALLGTRVFLQTGFTDANAPSGAAFSNGLEISIGQ